MSRSLIVSVSLLLLFTTNLSGQSHETGHRNNNSLIYAEFAGPLGGISANYRYNFCLPNGDIYAGYGFGLGIDGVANNFLAGYSLGAGKHQLSLAGFFSFDYEDYDRWSGIEVSYQFVGNRGLFIKLSPLIWYYYDGLSYNNLGTSPEYDKRSNSWNYSGGLGIGFRLGRAKPDQKSAFSRMTAYAEAGIYAIGTPISVNLEVRLNEVEGFQIYGRGGIGFGGEAFGDSGPGGILALSMLTGKGDHHFEIDAGVFAGINTFNGSSLTLPIIDLGYRMQKPGGGTVFKIKAGFLGIGIGIGRAF